MNYRDINQALLQGQLTGEVLPQLQKLLTQKFVFDADFGLQELPLSPGVIFIRGPRQYGKSTWLQQKIAATINEFGPGSALYINGDAIRDRWHFVDELISVAQAFPNISCKRLFIDEITAIDDWEKGIKYVLDQGVLADILIITTGSKARDLRRGTERLPGRKGKLDRTNYIFTPISYAQFKDKCGDFFKQDTLNAYILSGGAPVAINALAETGILPEYVSSIISEWILGEIAATGRSRSSLLSLLEQLYKMALTPIGQAKLARESGLANNTIAQGYIEILADLMCVVPVRPYDFDKQHIIYRKECKFHFVNMLMAIVWHPKKPRTIHELNNLGEDLAAIYEWSVAQELWRSACIKDKDIPDQLLFWQTKNHEIDFVEPQTKNFIEVKYGSVNEFEFTWFRKIFPKSKMYVVNKRRFTTSICEGLTLEDFLLTHHKP